MSISRYLIWTVKFLKREFNVILLVKEAKDLPIVIMVNSLFRERISIVWELSDCRLTHAWKWRRASAFLFEIKFHIIENKICNWFQGKLIIWYRSIQLSRCATYLFFVNLSRFSIALNHHKFDQIRTFSIWCFVYNLLSGLTILFGKVTFGWKIFMLTIFSSFSS